jgi:hypothetical protein
VAATLRSCRPEPISVGPVETRRRKRCPSGAGQHDEPFGQRLTALMIRNGGRLVRDGRSWRITRTQFNYFRGGIDRATWRCTEFTLPNKSGESQVSSVGHPTG